MVWCGTTTPTYACDDMTVAAHVVVRAEQKRTGSYCRYT